MAAYGESEKIRKCWRTRINVVEDVMANTHVVASTIHFGAFLKPRNNQWMRNGKLKRIRLYCSTGDRHTL